MHEVKSFTASYEIHNKKRKRCNKSLGWQLALDIRLIIKPVSGCVDDNWSFAISQKIGLSSEVGQ